MRCTTRVKVFFSHTGDNLHALANAINADEFIFSNYSSKRMNDEQMLKREKLLTLDFSTRISCFTILYSISVNA